MGNAKKVAGKAFDEGVKIFTEGQDPITGAKKVKKYAEVLEKKQKKK